MYSCVKLNLKNVKEFRKLNEFNCEFNNLNKDFFIMYDKMNFFKKYFLRKNVTLLKYNEQYVGYIWSEKVDINCTYINSMNVFLESNEVYCYNYLLKSLTAVHKKSQILEYSCEENEYFNILNELGFQIIDKVIELEKLVDDTTVYKACSDITYHTLVIDEDEELRCKIQNEIFQNKDRIPLIVEDIFYDEEQDYYYDKGAVFIKKNNTVIGYGQIILEDDSAIIVNFGIIPKYRGQGYGKKLMEYLFHVAKSNGIEILIIKVDADNEVALKLYESMGFIICKKYYNLQLGT